MRLSTCLTILFALLLSVPLWAQKPEAVAPPPPPPPPPPPSEEIFVVVEEMPRYPGCEELVDRVKRKECAQEALLKYIYENIEYPEAAKAAGQEGTAVVSFVVQPDGSLDKIKTVRDPGAGIGDAAAAIVHKMNTDGVRWIPGKQRGRAVAVRFNLPIRFRIPEEEKSPAVEEEAIEEEMIEEEPIFIDQEIEEEVEVEMAPPPPPPPPMVEEVEMAPPPPPMVEEEIEMAPAPPPPAPRRVQEVFKVVEQMPRFFSEDCESRSDKSMKEICSQEKMLQFIGANLRYPAEARENGTSGICVVSFIVEMDGSLSNATIIRDIGDGCGKEVLRIVDLMSSPGQWISGKQRGRPVRVQYNLPVRFKA